MSIGGSVKRSLEKVRSDMKTAKPQRDIDPTNIPAIPARGQPSVDDNITDMPLRANIVIASMAMDAAMATTSATTSSNSEY